MYCLLVCLCWDVAGLKDAQPRGKWAAVMAEHRRGPEEHEAPAEILPENAGTYALEQDVGIPLLAARPDAPPEASHPSGDQHTVSAIQQHRHQTRGPYTMLLILLLVFMPLFVAFFLVIMFVAGPAAKPRERANNGAAGVSLVSSTGSMSTSPGMVSPRGSFVAREGTGMSISLLGVIQPQPQETNVNVVESSLSSGDIWAQVCIHEDHQGTGILIHGHGSTPVAMLDTSFAFGKAGGPPPPNRAVKIHKVEPGSTSWDHVKQPYAEVRPGKGGFVMFRGGTFEELLSIRTDQTGRLSQVVSASSILAQVEASPNGSEIHMSAGGFDKHMVLCAIVAAMKLG